MIGAGGHAKVLLSIIQQLKLSILGVCDLRFRQSQEKSWCNVPILGDDEVITDYGTQEIMLINGIGKHINDFSRRDIFNRYKDLGYEFGTLIHPTAWVDPSAYLGEGVQVMAGAVIQVDAYIEKNVIVNTRACVDHDCQIGAHAFLAPGCVLCGNVKVENDVFIGAGAAIAPNMNIGNSAVIGAGTSVVRDVIGAQQILPAKIQTFEI